MRRALLACALLAPSASAARAASASCSAGQEIARRFLRLDADGTFLSPVKRSFLEELVVFDEDLEFGARVTIIRSYRIKHCVVKKSRLFMTVSYKTIGDAGTSWDALILYPSPIPQEGVLQLERVQGRWKIVASSILGKHVLPRAIIAHGEAAAKKMSSPDDDIDRERILSAIRRLKAAENN